MENVIGGHLSQFESFRNLGLIFEIDPTLIKIDDKILFFNEIVFSIIIENEYEIKSEGIYRNGKKEGSGAYGKAGLWISWHENGQKASEGNYVNELREGLWISWDSNGQKYEEGNYRNGKKEELWILWYENGQKSSEGNYLNEKEEGLWIDWYENGQKYSEGNYRNGKLEGLWIAWYENGQKLSGINYHRSIPTG